MSSIKPIKVGIIGGSGLDNPDILDDRKEKTVTTPFGDPSDSLIIGTINGVNCVLLPRHGRNHSYTPSLINFRANIWALKQEGCTHVVATTACGSLQENIHPGEIVLIDDFLDRTTKRVQTFYDGTSPDHTGVCHVPMSEPFCPRLRSILASSIKALSYPFHERGTMITIEGPRFSTRAESRVWRQWRGDVINMSTVPEVVLAKEAGLLYASLALVTDYDSWRDDHEAVHVEMAVKTFKENSSKAVKVLQNAIPKIAEENWDETIQKSLDIARMSIM
ncbi:S-methyl-5'-thioadenosine phosphorylase-like [Physella acuta]|uniref:S-methyl-5'-thioadenosine phosphorylase-like n=1 Tax=Physella acuta TaxID=109671 RepID=UPI0027DEA649|nr:S-methyl-5'-thioadenosine phosphorylase-like [Physella acuta]XP_059142947.1 S-methyl-5'-thioadenosine phosphorylase-like [Physella acuta]